MSATPRFHLTLVALLVSVGTANAQFGLLETDHLRLIYQEPTLTYLAPYVARCYENSLRSHRALFDYTPGEKTTVILNDLSDYGNAGAGAAPRNSVVVSVAPISLVYETYPSNERLNTLMNHELVHIVALDRTAGSDRFFRAVFNGKVRPTSEHPESIVYSYMTTPRSASPRWFHEGLAVFVETWMAGGAGRALGAYDEMVFRSMVRDGSHIYSALGLESEGTKIDFQVGVNSYLYGTRFISYLALRYSPEQVVEWAARREGGKIYFAAEFERIFGAPLGRVWDEWIGWENGFQQQNLDAIRAYPTTPYDDVSDQALGSVSRSYYDAGARTLYTAVNYPGEVAHIAAISVDDGELRRLVEVKGAALYFVTSLAFDPVGGRLYFTTDNNDWRDLSVVDIESGELRVLQRDVRIGDLAFNALDASLWGIRHFNGISTIVRIPPPYEEWNQIYSWPYGHVAYDLDVSPDGSLLSIAIGEINGRQTLRLMDAAKLAAGDTTSTIVHDFGTAIPANFVFSPDGRYLYGSSYYTGVSNIFRYDVVADSMDAVTNTETGFFRPIPVAGDSLIVFRYTGRGFVPAWVEAEPLFDINPIRFLGQEIVERHPVVKSWIAGSPGSVEIDSLVVYRGEYEPLKNLEVTSIYPIVEGYKDYPAYGLRVDVSDPLSMHKGSLAASYTPNSSLPATERLHLALRYNRYRWNGRFTINDADFYDLFGPTKRSRKGYALGISYDRNLIYDPPKQLELAAGVTGYAKLETVPYAQNVASSASELVSASVQLKYRDMRASLGAVEYERGYRWEMLGFSNVARGRVFGGLNGTFDFGVPLFFHSSLWLRSSAGVSPGPRDEPFANFYFGGFGNNWVDYRPEKRYHQWYSFPGIEINEVGGTNYAKVLGEWNLPPIRFRRLGKAGFYATWLRTAVFMSGLATNLDAGEERTKVANAGFQIDLRMTLLSNLKMTLSTGYAAAVKDEAHPSDEFMISLKIL